MSVNPQVAKYTVGGVKVELPRSILNERIEKIMQGGTYEAREARILEKIIAKGEIILELGAGIGFISTLAAKNANTKSVHAVEADPRLLPVIQRTHELNDVSATIYSEMLGATDGTHTFHLAHSFIASSSSGVWGGREIEVKMTSFQRRLDEIQPTLLIVDIEGGEVELFKDVQLTSVNKIMMELHQNVTGIAGIKSVFDQLSVEGFGYDAENSWGGVVTLARA